MALASRWVVTPAVVLALCLAPLGMKNYHAYLAQLMMINIIAALGLNLLTGNAGQISLCHSSFMAVGAYTTTLLLLRGVPFPVALAGGTVVATALGACLGYPARRVAGLYLALVTLGFLELVQLAIEELPDLTGGVRGLSVPKPTAFGFDLHSDRARYYLVLVATLFAVYVAYHLQRSRYGRAFDAIRQAPFAAQALGIPLAATKLLAFSVAAAFAGFAGGLTAVVVGFIDPTEFGISTSLRHITFIVVGGLGSIAGSILGAVLLTGLPEILRGAKEYSDLIYGGILLASILLMPRGVAGLLGRVLSRPARSGVIGP